MGQSVATDPAGIVELKLTVFLARDLLAFLDEQSTLPPVARAFRMELAARLHEMGRQ